MTTTELKKLAEAATPGPWIAGNDEDSDYLLVGPHDGDCIVFRPVVKLHNERNAEYIAAANPAAILKLLAINAELVDALNEAFSMLGSRLIKDTFGYEWHEKARAALAKAEGGEL